jgi:hypothetical protein
LGAVLFDTEINATVKSIVICDSSQVAVDIGFDPRIRAHITHPVWPAVVVHDPIRCKVGSESLMINTNHSIMYRGLPYASLAKQETTKKHVPMNAPQSTEYAHTSVERPPMEIPPI